MNHLFIGLGGTGGRIIKSLRQLHHQYTNETDASSIGVDYLWVDTDPASFTTSQSDWQRHGTSLRLPAENQLLMSNNLKSVVANLQDYPKVKSWFGDPKPWAHTIDNLSASATTAQKRPLGRVLFATHIDDFNSQVQKLVQKLSAKTGDDGITFHVLAGLAGGTGSAIIIDVLAQLRKNFAFMPRNSSNHRILAYTYLPCDSAPKAWDKGNYHANAYAALVELNALNVGSWTPVDIATGQRFNKKLEYAFNGCYVFTDHNSRGYNVGIDNHLPHVVADFIYSKVMLIRQVGWQALERAENCENGDCLPELDAQEPARCVRFMSFGISRLQFPRERIFESLSYEYQLQALQQLRFNNWQEGHGFVNMRRAFSSTDYLNDNHAYDKWMLTDAHLLLEKPIINSDASAKWQAHDLTWMALGNHYLSLVTQLRISKGLPEIYRLLNHSFNEYYREGRGVKGYFNQADADIEAYAKHIVTTIEKDIFADWGASELSLTECLDVVTTLRRHLETKMTEATDRIAKKEQLGQRYKEAYEALINEWSSLSFLSKSTQSHEDYVVKAGVHLREYYYTLTYMHAYEYQKRLSIVIIKKLATLQNQIKKSNLILERSVEMSKKAIASRVVSYNYSLQYAETLENPAHQKSVRKKLVLNRNIQHRHTEKVRWQIFELLGIAPTFKRFIVQQEDVRQALLQYCFENVKEAHNNHITERDERIFDVSIIDKLHARYDHNETLSALDNKARQLLKETGSFAEVSSSQLNINFAGRLPHYKENRAMNTTSILMPMPMPMPDRHKQFTDTLKKAFKTNYNGNHLDFIKTADDSKAITVLSITNLIPLRTMNVVLELKKHYDAQVRHNLSKIKSELYLEGDGSSLPSLFVNEDNQIATVAKPLLLLALSSGILVAQSDLDGNNTHIVQPKNSYYGIDMTPVEWGHSLLSIVNTMTDKQLTLLRHSIKNKVQPNVPYSNNELIRLRSNMQSTLADIKQQLAVRSQKEADIIVSDWVKAANQVIEFAKGRQAL